MQVKDLFFDADNDSFAAMFHVEQSRATKLAKQINILTQKFNSQFSGRPLNPDELADLANVISHPTRFLYRVYGEIEVVSLADVVLVYSLAYQKFEQVKRLIPADMLQLITQIHKRQ